MGATILLGETPFAGLGFLSWAGHLLAVWLLGISLGWLLPRPKWARRGFNAKSAFMLTPPGLWLGRLVAAWNALLVVREVWYLRFSPGTFRAFLRAVYTSITTGRRLAWPPRVDATDPASSATGTTTPVDPLRWYVTTADLEFCRDAIDRDVGPVWEEMFRKEWPGCSYTAWRRSLPNGKTEYKSVTVSEDATAQEFMDFYLDDNTRPKWDGMISEHQLLEAAHDFDNRCQVVRWVRSFPFAFVSRREYVIARRLFALKDESGVSVDGSALYGISKGIDHPAAPPLQGLVRMSTFYSMWRSRTVPCPQGSDRPACETTLLHFEDFGIPENLARFAVRHGMAGFVGKMVPFVRSFVEERRSRCKPYQADRNAYGAGMTPVMNGQSPAAAAALDRSLSTSTQGSFLDDSASEQSGHAPRRSPSMRGLGYMLVASGVAIALSRAGSSGALDGAGAAQHASSKTASSGTAGSAGHSPRGRDHRKHLTLRQAHMGHRMHGLHAHRVHRQHQRHRSHARFEGLRSHKVHAEAEA